MLTRVPDPHEVLDEVLAELRVDDRRPAIVKSRWARVTSKSWAMRVLIVLARSFAMVVDIMRLLPTGRTIVVREFWNLPLMFMAPLLFAWRRRILWNVNHNLRNQADGFPPVLSLAARSGFQFLLFDGGAAVARFPLHVQRAFSTPLFPVHRRSTVNRSRPVGVRIALVGDMRPEKITPEELDAVLRSLSSVPGAHLRVGSRSGAMAQAKVPPGVALADTSTRARYLGLLAESDIVVILARRDTYFYRHSGTVLDAISCGAWPVVPAFPVLEVQVGLPVPVGSTYASVQEIGAVVKDAIASLESMQERRARYFSGREIANVQLKALRA